MFVGIFTIVDDRQMPEV